MDTAHRVGQIAASAGYELRCMGVPKTIDNDLDFTDHCPGYGSAAKYIATSVAEVFKDTHVYDVGTITVVEIMGRHAGWLTAAASLASLSCAPPNLVYLPEVDFNLEKFVEDVSRIYKETGKCLVAVSEGIHYADGAFVSEAKTSATDGFGHAQLGGLASLLAALIKQRTGSKVRGIELSLLQRCSAHLASAVDVKEAEMAGRVAVESAVAGETGQMVAFACLREKGVYSCWPKLIPLSDVANYESKVPLEWINKEGNFVTEEFIDYVMPLIQGEPPRPTEHSLPRYAKLKKIPAK